MRSGKLEPTTQTVRISASQLSVWYPSRQEAIEAARREVQAEIDDLPNREQRLRRDLAILSKG